MSAKFRNTFILMLTLLAMHSVSTGQTLPPAIQWIPQDAVISLEISDPKALLEFLAGDKATATITALPLYREQVSKPQIQELINVIKLMETALDTDCRTALAKLTGGGITFAVCPEDTILLIIDAEDEHMLRRFHELLLNLARSEAEKQGKSGHVASTQYEDITAWTFDGKEAHTIIGKRFILSNRPEGLKAVLDLRAKGQGASLMSKSSYQDAKSQAEPDAVATAYADLKVLMQIPNVKQLFSQTGRNPLAALTFAGIVESIRDSNWLALGLYINDSTLILRASADGKMVAQTSPAAFALPKESDEGAMPNLPVPNRIAAMTLYRDMHQFYTSKDDLFPERTSGLIFFENMMGIFFSGRDLTNEVLAHTEPEIRLVVAEQKFDQAIGTPAVKLPAFALVLRLRDEEEFDEIAEEAWQKAIGLVNFTRGQQALPGLIIDRPSYANTKMTVCSFSTTDVEDRKNLPQRFNVRPTLAMPNDFLILSSTDGLARDLIDAVDNETEHHLRPKAQIHSLVEIEGDQLASILNVNRRTVVRGNMVKKGLTEEQAESEIDILISLAKLCEHLELSIGMNEGTTEAKLKLKLDLQ